MVLLEALGMTPHPLAEAAATWTTDEAAVATQQQIGEQVDRIVAGALRSTEPAVIREAVRQLDHPVVVWVRMNMPAPVATKWYEQRRRALHQRAVDLFGSRDGQLTAPRLEHEPFARSGGLPGQLFRR
jgi:hypothetical protein